MTRVISFFRAIGRKIKTIAMEIGDWAYAIWITFKAPPGE